MRLFLGFALLSVASVFTACTVGDDGPSGSEPREVCGTPEDDDGDGFLNDADQDCWPAADAGPGPAADSGPGTPPPPALVNVRLYWRSERPLDFAQIQGCLHDGGPCIVDRFNLGRDDECAVHGEGAVVCRLSAVPAGTRIDYNGFGQIFQRNAAGEIVRNADGSPVVAEVVWGVGLDGTGGVRTIGTMFVSEDRDRNSTYDVDRTSSVVINTEGDGRNWSIVVGR